MTPSLCRKAVFKSPSESVALLEPRGWLVQTPLRDDAACSEGWGAGKLGLPCACCLHRGGKPIAGNITLKIQKGGIVLSIGPPRMHKKSRGRSQCSKR